jgi:hypothetical protein
MERRVNRGQEDPSDTHFGPDAEWPIGYDPIYTTTEVSCTRAGGDVTVTLRLSHKKAREQQAKQQDKGAMSQRNDALVKASSIIT